MYHSDAFFENNRPCKDNFRHPMPDLLIKQKHCNSNLNRIIYNIYTDGILCRDIIKAILMV